MTSPARRRDERAGRAADATSPGADATGAGAEGLHAAERRVAGRRVAGLAAAGLGAAGLALSAWLGTLTSRAGDGHDAVAATVVLAVLGALWMGRERQRASSRAWAAATWGWSRKPGWPRLGGAGWALLSTSVAGWDLASFADRSPALPTLSQLVGHVSAHPEGRATLVALWLIAGACLVAGGRPTATRRSPRRALPPGRAQL